VNRSLQQEERSQHVVVTVWGVRLYAVTVRQLVEKRWLTRACRFKPDDTGSIINLCVALSFLPRQIQIVPVNKRGPPMEDKLYVANQEPF